MNALTFTGYDGSTITVGSRVEIHPATDLWMRGARFGTVTKECDLTDRLTVKLDKVRKPVLVTPVTLRAI